MHILIGATGSVACIKLPDLVRELKALKDAEVKVVLTEKAHHFVDTEKLAVQVHTDKEEWMWQGRGDPVLHIELRKWADLFVIAPLDANTLAKLANGICDNLLHIAALSSLGYEEIPPITKRLVCGDEGQGAMAQVETIVSRVKEKVEAREDTKETCAQTDTQ